MILEKTGTVTPIGNRIQQSALYAVNSHLPLATLDQIPNTFFFLWPPPLFHHKTGVLVHLVYFLLSMEGTVPVQKLRYKRVTKFRRLTLLAKHSLEQSMLPITYPGRKSRLLLNRDKILVHLHKHHKRTVQIGKYLAEYRILDFFTSFYQIMVAYSFFASFRQIAVA
jgi:hypothetical protein